MDVNDCERFSGLMQSLGSCFNWSDIDKDIVERFYLRLKDYRFEDIETATRIYLTQGERFPTVRDLVGILEEYLCTGRVS